jgi:drug/metabolite transporter (DMT)-like permease
MLFFKNLTQKSQAIYCCILACFFASILISLVRFLSAEFHVFFIVMMRNLFALLFFTPQIFKNYQAILKTSKPHLHIFRGINGLFSMLIWFHVISALPLSEAVSLSFVTPILTTIAAIFLFKEKSQIRTFVGSFFGFLGILIILRPGFREFNPAYFYSFASMISWSISNLTIKFMTKTEKPQTIAAYMSLMIFIFSIPFAIPHFQAINLQSFLLFAALGLTSNLTVIFTAKSYSKADLSILQPLDFTRLIFISIISYFFFGEIIDFWVIIGSLVILFGVIIAVSRKKNRNNFATPLAAKVAIE